MRILPAGDPPQMPLAVLDYSVQSLSTIS